MTVLCGLGNIGTLVYTLNIPNDLSNILSYTLVEYYGVFKALEYTGIVYNGTKRIECIAKVELKYN